MWVQPAEITMAKKTPETDLGVTNAVGSKFEFSQLNPNF